MRSLDTTRETEQLSGEEILSFSSSHRSKSKETCLGVILFPVFI